MANVNATKYGVAGSSFGSSWTTARQTGDFVTNQPSTADSTALMVVRGSRGGIQYRITRAFLAFDLSAYVGQTITNLTLTFRQTSNTVSGGLQIAILKSTAQGSGSTFSDLTTSDFYSTIDFSTEYANFIPFMSSSNSTNTQTLTTAANLDASSGFLRLVMVQLVNDKLDVTPTADQNENGNWNLDTSSSGFIPFLAFTATSWGEKINGVPVGTIEKVNGVIRNTIESINRFGGTDGCFAFAITDSNSPGSFVKVYSSIEPSTLDVDDVVYSEDSCTTPFVGLGSSYDYQTQGGPVLSSCDNSSIPTVIYINSDGEIIGIDCAPV